MYTYSDQDDRYLFSFMLLVSVFIIYGVYKHNPNFMNRKPLAESLSESQSQSFTIPKNNTTADALGPWNFIEGRNISTTHILDPEVMLANNYVRETLKPLPTPDGIQNKFIVRIKIYIRA